MPELTSGVADEMQTAMIAFSDKDCAVATAMYYRGEYITMDVEEFLLGIDDLGILDVESPKAGIWIWEGYANIIEEGEWDYTRCHWRTPTIREWQLLQDRKNPLERVETLWRTNPGKRIRFLNGPTTTLFVHDVEAAKSAYRGSFLNAETSRRGRWVIPMKELATGRATTLSLSDRSYREMRAALETQREQADKSRVSLHVEFDTETYKFTVRPVPEGFGVLIDQNNNAVVVNPPYKNPFRGIDRGVDPNPCGEIPLHPSEMERFLADADASPVNPPYKPAVELETSREREAWLYPEGTYPAAVAYPEGYNVVPSATYAAMTDPKTIISEIPVPGYGMVTKNPPPGFDWYGNKI